MQTWHTVDGSGIQNIHLNNGISTTFPSTGFLAAFLNSISTEISPTHRFELGAPSSRRQLQICLMLCFPSPHHLLKSLHLNFTGISTENQHPWSARSHFGSRVCFEARGLSSARGKFVCPCSFHRAPGFWEQANESSSRCRHRGGCIDCWWTAIWDPICGLHAAASPKASLTHSPTSVLMSDPELGLC